MRVVQQWSSTDAAFAQVQLSVMLAVLGVLLIAAGWAAAKGRLKRNHAVGMRTSTILRNDETWRVAHQRCAWSFWSSGLVMVFVSVLIAALRPSQAWTAALWIAMSAYLIIAVLVGFAQADKEARAVR